MKSGSFTTLTGSLILLIRFLARNALAPRDWLPASRSLGGLGLIDDRSMMVTLCYTSAIIGMSVRGRIDGDVKERLFGSAIDMASQIPSRSLQLIESLCISAQILWIETGGAAEIVPSLTVLDGAALEICNRSLIFNPNNEILNRTKLSLDENRLNIIRNNLLNYFIESKNTSTSIIFTEKIKFLSAEGKVSEEILSYVLKNEHYQKTIDYDRSLDDLRADWKRYET